jgi:radical SAM protein with 4Fe4S-binding SPASM domain
MSGGYVRREPLPEFSLWERRRAKNALLSFTLEVTARCNQNCRHCYINLPEKDSNAKAAELTIHEIKEIADQAVDLGAVWCLITGGEPLLREDFEEIYLYLKQKGLLVSVFTNATRINESRAALFAEYPPRAIEITVYGVSRETYGDVTRRPDLFPAFLRGITRLVEAGVKFGLKAVPIQANLGEYPAIADFCRKLSHKPFRFDPMLHLRFDGDGEKNREIRRQRLKAEQIAALEGADRKRRDEMEKNCDKLILSKRPANGKSRLFACGAGLSEFVVSHNGYYRLCSSLWHPDCIYDLRRGSVRDARENLVPKVRAMKSDREAFLENCASCQMINLCLWCPANSWLETGHLDLPWGYFCDVARERSRNLKKAPGPESGF